MNTVPNETSHEPSVRAEAAKTSSRNALQTAQHAQWSMLLPLLDHALSGRWERCANSVGQVEREAFLAFITAHDLNDGLYWLIHRAGASKHFPAWLLLHLLAARQRGQGRRADLLEAQQRFAQACQRSGAGFILLKGFYLAQRFYTDIQARQLRDIDVLAWPGNEVAISQVLTGMGYSKPDPSVLPRLLPLPVRRRLEHAHTWQCEHISIDVHYTLRARPGFNLQPGLWFERATSVKIGGMDYQVLGDEDALCMSLIALATDIEQGNVKGRDLLDAEVMLHALGAGFDWAGWLQQLREARVLNLIVAVLGIIRGALPGPRPWPEWLEQAGCRLQAAPRNLCLQRLSALPYGLSSRRWFLDHYQGSRLVYLGWWLLGGWFREGSIGSVQDSLRSGSNH